jgi:hypothetical protein
MAKKLLLLLPLLTGLPLFLTGALGRPATAPVTSVIPFNAEPISLPPDINLAGKGAAALYERAMERLAPQRVSWLNMKLWQRMAEGELAFESDGTLQLGPRYCARLEITVRGGGLLGRRLVVSDGHALAHVTQFGNDEPTEDFRLVAPPPTPEQPTPISPEAHLWDLACGGPHALLVQLRARLKDITGETGRLQGRPVIRLQGRLDTATAAPHGTAARADFCYVYLDAHMLWPGRLEWWVADRDHRPRLVLEMEFRDPQVNEPLSVQDCIRAFTYRPSGGS